MTDGTILSAKCPGCGGPSIREGWHCLACLDETMKKMTPEDWKREIGAMCDDILAPSGDGEQAPKDEV